MVQAVFYHKHDSSYDDITGKQYHFPKTYLGRVQKTEGDWIIYYGPIPFRKGRYYSGIAKVTGIRRDPYMEDHFYADLSDYLDFDRLVSYSENGGYEKRMFLPNGRVNGGTSQSAVRLLESAEFDTIVQAGLATPDEWPDRTDPPIPVYQMSDIDQAPLLPDQTPFSMEGYQRPIVSQLLNRPFRDAKFRQNIRKIYDRTCSFTGLRLINGGGRPEVEAAHIIPVESGGSDSLQNGIALSGTVHWMFDRGLLSLANDFTILCSRHLNYDVTHLLRKDMKAWVPREEHLRPHQECLAWHREHIFKQ